MPKYAYPFLSGGKNVVETTKASLMEYETRSNKRRGNMVHVFVIWRCKKIAQEVTTHEQHEPFQVVVLLTLKIKQDGTNFFFFRWGEEGRYREGRNS